MLDKWKSILTNWINCYLNDKTEKNQSVNHEALLNIITHLRDNLSLDESKSSVLEAHTLEEFIVEKYPNFVFENGTVEPVSDDELYVVASLLLFFVCVKSKDVDLKREMCSRLSRDDQETILNFNKTLMSCPVVTCKEVENAILESCGQDTARFRSPDRTTATVAETPPALRTKHGEVRRLQAALEAERFDRAFLQEELARTQARIERLATEKEQHKVEILNLKAKMTSCCGSEAEARAERGADKSVKKWLQQIEDLEQRLVVTREQLDDAVYERDAYKTKIEELKLERDKWLSFGQQESSRAAELSGQLVAERRTVESLRELVTELSQHNRHNGLDGSQLECDDPDASVHSLGHNLSICNEACNNVVEVQLGEERAKVAELKAQIQNLQDQLNELNRKTEEEKASLQKIAFDKDEDILNLKHRINEEIEDKNNVKSFYSNECSKLNNEINELEQRIKDNHENYTSTVNGKMREIVTLQEEKLSLLQSLHDETTKLETIIKDHENTIQSLQTELYTEKNSKQKIKEDADSHIMKLNEKVLNRNNELVELQNNISAKSEMIEELNLNLRKEKESKNALSNKMQAEIVILNEQRSELDYSVKEKVEQIQRLETQLHEKVAHLDKVLKEFHQTSEMEDQLNRLNEDVKSKAAQIERLEKQNRKLADDLMKNNEDLTHLNEVLDQLAKANDILEKSLQDKKLEYEIAVKKQKDSLVKIEDQIKEKENEVKVKLGELKDSKDIIRSTEEKLNLYNNEITQLRQEKETLLYERDEYVKKIEEMTLSHEAIASELKDETNKLREENAHLVDTVEDNKNVNTNLEQFIQRELEENQTDRQENGRERINLVNKCTILKQSLAKAELEISQRRKEVTALQYEIRTLRETIHNAATDELKEKDAVIGTISKALVEEKNAKKRLEVELEAKVIELDGVKEKMEDMFHQTSEMEDQLNRLNEDVKSKAAEIERLEKQNRKLADDLEKNNEDLTHLNEVLDQLAKANDILEKSLQDKKLEYEIAVKKQKDSLVKIEDQIKEKENEVKVKLGELNDSKDIIRSIEEKLNLYNNEITQLRQEKETLLYERDEYVKKIEEMTLSLEANASELKDEINKLREENAHLVDIVEENKNDLTHLNEVLDQLAKANGILEKSLQDKKLEYEIAVKKQKDSLVKIEDQIKEKENEVKVKLGELNDSKDIIRSTEEKLNLYNNEITQLRQEKETLLYERDEYVKKIEEMTLSHEAIASELKDETNKLREENAHLVDTVEDNKNVITNLEQLMQRELEENQTDRQENGRERINLVNKCTILEQSLAKAELEISQRRKEVTALQYEIRTIRETIHNAATDELKEKDAVIGTISKALVEEKNAKKRLEVELEAKVIELDGVKEKMEDMFHQTSEMEDQLNRLNEDVKSKAAEIERLEKQNRKLADDLEKNNEDLTHLNEVHDQLAKAKDILEKSLQDKKLEYEIAVKKKKDSLVKIEDQIKEKEIEVKVKLGEVNDSKDIIRSIEEKLYLYNNEITQLIQEKENLVYERDEYVKKIEEMTLSLEANASELKDEINNLREENAHLVDTVEENKNVITNLEQLIQRELEENQTDRQENGRERINLVNKCTILEQNLAKAELEISERHKEVTALQYEIRTLRETIHNAATDELKEKDAVIGTISKDLVEEKNAKKRLEIELEAKVIELDGIRKKMEDMVSEKEALLALKVENVKLVKAVGQREIFTTTSQDKGSSCKLKPSPTPLARDYQHQVDMSPSGTAHSSIESIKTISDLEKIVNDKNRTITTLQSDLSYMKTLMAESENNLLDMTKELELSKETCLQLSNQLKKIVHQKNEELADLKKQVSKLCATETRATQIIKVSAKYQAIILKRIAEIKSNTILKEITNFGNSANVNENERRSLAGTVTMEDLENFLETTDRHLKRCSEKQIALQKERDRLSEVNRINESEIINMKKFLTELSVMFKTFRSVKEIYAQRLSRVVSLQRTVRREILSLDGRITDGAMCKLERGYTAVMQDLAECAMTLERWVERCIDRTISPEKIKQAFAYDMERASLSSGMFQNTSLEVQLEELERSFQKLLEDILRAPKGDGAVDQQSVTVMEVRAEYEDKLNRMKAKMKQLYQEQISVFREKQKEEIAVLERELQKARDKLAESSRSYEEHIKSLTSELWRVGEKFLVKKDEADWLRNKRAPSLQSLQHVHSSGLMPPEQPSRPRPSDASSLRSLPVHPKKSETRTLHMSDEEGEVFDNRYLRSLESPRRRSPPPRAGHPARLSELQWRNSLQPPHLRSCYPAETQFAPALHEDDIKGAAAASVKQRKEVGITAYKKPGPPTPSKQAGRLSATDSELRESLRPDPSEPSKKSTSTPSRLRALFRSSRNDTNEGTPRRRLSIFRNKK